MEHLRKVLLLVSVVTLIPAQVLPQSSPRDGNTLSAAIHFYNQVHGTKNAFKVLETHPPPSNQGALEQRLKFLSFTMKETMCPRNEEFPLQQCDFKRDGLVKKCQASVSNEQDIVAIILTCDLGALLLPRSRRALYRRRKYPTSYYLLLGGKGNNRGYKPHIIYV